MQKEAGKKKQKQKSNHDQNSFSLDNTQTHQIFAKKSLMNGTVK